MESLKQRTARTMKWSVIDRVSSQLMYAVTGIVLARLLSPYDFGLVGALLIFQAFALLMVDSGFSYALIQRKAPTRLDYSSVLWFNLVIAVTIYAVLFVCAPLIATLFQGDMRLVPLSRVMFLTFILNASAIVQTNRLTKEMNMRPVALANFIALVCGGIAGIVLAVMGYGAWAIVWQSVVLAAVKSIVLWMVGKWTPLLRFSMRSLRSFLGVSTGMMFTSFLNTLFLNLYSFVIGNRVGMVPLGYYTQSDKWSKMGVSSMTQVLTSSFLPVLSGVQDDAERFRRVVSKMNRVTAYLLFPLMIGLIVAATPIFHALFGTKWDASIALFQLLLVRGVFTVLTGLYTNYILALGHSRTIVGVEVVRDTVAVVALVVTFPFMGMTTAADPVMGIRILLWGQVFAGFVAWLVTLRATVRITGAEYTGFLADNAPYLAMSVVIGALMYFVGEWLEPVNVWAALVAQCAIGIVLYLGANHVLNSRVQHDALAYIRGKKI